MAVSQAVGSRPPTAATKAQSPRAKINGSSVPIVEISSGEEDEESESESESEEEGGEGEKMVGAKTNARKAMGIHSNNYEEEESEEGRSGDEEDVSGSNSDSDSEQEEEQTHDLKNTHTQTEKNSNSLALQPDSAEEPTFGDMIRATGSDSADADDPSGYRSLNPRHSQNQLSNANSLSSILTQALRTNDNDLFATCFSTHDPHSIRATVERLESPLATTLLRKLADVLHRQPGRANGLMVWIQWTIVAHGGYLATQPDLMKQLNSLRVVLQQRTRALKPLLALKGKLDMLESQLEIRRRMKQTSRRDGNGDDDEEGVIYVEGQNDDDGGDEEEDVHYPGNTTPSSNSLSRLRKQINGIPGGQSDSDGYEDEDLSGEDMPTGNYGADQNSNASGEDSDADSEGFIDDEAEEGSDEMDEDAVDYDDFSGSDEEDDVSESESEAPPAKRVATKSNRVGRTELHAR